MAESERIRDERTIWERGADMQIENIDEGRPIVSNIRNHVGISGNSWGSVNYAILEQAAVAKSYSDPRWITEKQAEDLGIWKKKGEKAHHIVKQRRFKMEPKIDPQTGTSSQWRQP